jgi:hypothetical protein
MKDSQNDDPEKIIYAMEINAINFEKIFKKIAQLEEEIAQSKSKINDLEETVYKLSSPNCNNARKTLAKLRAIKK